MSAKAVPLISVRLCLSIKDFCAEKTRFDNNGAQYLRNDQKRINQGD
jgi:hypothetical protein